MSRSTVPFVIVLLAGLMVSACTPGPGTVEPTATYTPVIIAVAPTPSPTHTVTPASPTPTNSPTPETPTPSVTPCGPPSGWVVYTVRAGDTLFSLASQVGFSQESVMLANCLVSPDLVVGQVLYLPFIPCTPAPPPGWTLYTVRAGDTLFSLAVTRGSSVDEVTRVNCLSSTGIGAGQTLYLPPAPIPPPPPPPPVATPCSAFGCPPKGELPRIALAPGGPNDPGFKPCSGTKGFPWISVETENQENNDLAQGQRAYYFACEFPDPTKLMAQMSGPSGVQTLTILSTIPNLDLQMHQAKGVVVWNATCDLKTGENAYTLTMWDGNGSQAQLTFSLTTTLFQRILTVPYQSGPAGTTFQIYYCGYGTQAGKEVVMDFYYGVKRTDPQGGYDFYHADSWNILINANGWAMQPLQSFSGDPARAYLIRDREEALKGYDLIWLLP